MHCIDVLTFDECYIFYPYLLLTRNNKRNQAKAYLSLMGLGITFKLGCFV